MLVKIFDEEHEFDLQCRINDFLCSGDYDIMDIKYSVAISIFGEDQIYCFSAMIVYDEK